MEVEEKYSSVWENGKSKLNNDNNVFISIKE